MDKPEIKKVKSYSLKPSNIAWLRDLAFRQSTAENPVSASELLDQLIDEARQASQAAKSTPPLPTQEKKTPVSAAAIRAAVPA